MFTAVPVGEDPDEYARDVIRPLIQAKVGEIIAMSETIGQKVTNGVNIGRAVLATAPTGTADYNSLFGMTNDTDVWVTDIVEQTVFKLNQNIDALIALNSSATLSMVQALLDGATNSVYDSLSVGDPVTYVDNINEVTTPTNYLSELAVTLNPYSNPVAVPVALSTLVNTDNAVGSSRVDLQACKLEYSIVSPK